MWARHRAVEPTIVSAGGAVAAFVVDAGAVRFAGEAHVTDYHTPLGSRTDSLIAAVADVTSLPLELDSLPAEAAEPLAASCRTAGFTVMYSSDEESCQVVDLVG
ncbi:MAG: hypothetical protein GWO04_49860, partial [Actinobacteria bacterium]|nr:hypothetical protein [Actinomycetota bacterium]